ncbi:RNA methyltransferase [Halomonas sp. H33-56]|uniref:RNA methyltransferase n=1 Tax=Halomonas sp. H33-56 TaxID=2950873 RepID=UPI0032DFF155
MTQALPFANLRIVLVQTYHPGNIGSAARAMKTMGLTDLVLVNPRVFPDEEATRLAAGAADVVENARVVERLEDAIDDCVRVVGASARLRSLPLPHYDEPDEMAQALVKDAVHDPVALVFGRERFGLTNDEIRLCSHQVSIPANPDYGILNLSQAVQVLAYELRRAWRRLPCPDIDVAVDSDADTDTDTDTDTDNVATSGTPSRLRQPTREQVAHFQAHLGRVMRDSGFITQPHARTEEQLQALFARATPTRKELSLLRGLLSSLEAHLPPSSDDRQD